MYPFWETVIAPLVRTAQARRVVEIGALRGETTVKMLEDLGPDAEIHVIDPLPQFDPAAHEAKFPGQYIFHRALSLEVLPELPAFDIALIDGDHNWYTVYNECRLLREASRREGTHLPLMVLHDVGWPYGRRDLYYDPSNIPEHEQQPWDTRGMMPGRTALLKGGGMNINLANAIEEGGPRNGVRTGLDDFIAEHDQPLRQLVIPIYYGLAIVAEEAYLDDHPAVRDMLDRIESPQGVRDLLELSEAIRLDEVVLSHNIERMRGDRLERAVDRHLALLRESLIDAHYVDNEARLQLAVDAATRRRPLDAEQLRAPRRRTPQAVRDLEAARAAGPTGPGSTAGHFAFTDIGRTRLAEIHEALDTVTSDGIAGDLIDIGCGRGGVGIYFRGYLDAHETTDRTVWVADEFRSTPADGMRPLDEAGVADLWPDLNEVRDAYARYALLDERVRFVQGPPADALPGAPIETLAVIRIGRQVSATIGAALDAVYPRLSVGGIVIIEGADDHDRTAQIEAFMTAHGVTGDQRVGWDGHAWRKHADDVTAGPVRARQVLPLAPPATNGVIDLSVVVILHNMRREAQRTLHSLSRSYQRGIDDLRYEVIVVENGSDAHERLGADFVAAFGPEFRYVDMGDDAPPTPVTALNEGIRLARGDHLALMIDGAHVLSPGVLAHGLSGLEAYAPAIVATQQWYVGPGQQPDATAAGYDETVEDRLFDNIAWPSDGYRLFEISHFIGERDWLDGLLESNCMFVPRSLLEQVGGFDESFSTPGGGYANLELYERLGAHPGVRVVTILGEGSFHQVHDGTTTNDTSLDDRRAKTYGYGEHFRTLRGRTLGGPAKHLHFVGSFQNRSSYRTRARRVPEMAFTDADAREGGIPTSPMVLPDEIRTTMIDAFWHTLAWQRSTWLGEPVTTPPTDLHIYQELITAIRPEHVIVAGRAGGGVAHFAASICDALGSGSVIALGADEPPAHARITRIDGAPHAETTATSIRALLGDRRDALVILGSGAGAEYIEAEFAALAPFVGVGSYVIVENTIVNGNPVWPNHGAGPLEALRRLLPHHGNFVQDTTMERFGLSFNLGGYLRCVA